MSCARTRSTRRFRSAVTSLERNRLGDFIESERDVLVLLREHEVAVLLYSGHTPADIERRLGIGRRTVYEHVRHMHRKLGVKNAQELMLASARLFISDVETG